MKLWKCSATTLIASLSINANASLIARDLDGNTSTVEAYYDDVADLTWLADANYAQTSGFDADGRMNWADANSWATGLSIGGVEGWRLATTEPALSGYIQTSEMGNLFYNVLGNSAYSSPLKNTGPFSNVQSYYYWTATEYAHRTNHMWSFNMSNGYQLNELETFSNYAWAVQSGDVSAVPVPAAVWLFGSGLLGLAGISRRKKA